MFCTLHDIYIIKISLFWLEALVVMDQALFSMDSEFLTNREGRISYGLMDQIHIFTDRKLGDREVQRKLA